MFRVRPCTRIRIRTSSQLLVHPRIQYSKLVISRGFNTNTLIDKLFFRKPKQTDLQSPSLWDNISSSTSYLPSELIGISKRQCDELSEFYKSLGKLYILYFIAKQNLLSSKLAYDPILDSITSAYSSQIEKDVSRDDTLSYIGVSSIQDPQLLDSLFSSYANLSFTQDKFMKRFNSQVPFAYDIIDNDTLHSNNQQDVFEFPSLPGTLEFSPLFLIDTHHAAPFSKLVYNRECDTPELQSLLLSLLDLGVTSTNFHLKALKEDAIIEDETIKSVLINSLINRIIKLPSAQDYISNLIENDPQYRANVFYQYIGLVTLMNGKFPLQWLQNICDHTKNSESSILSNKLVEIPTQNVHPSLRDIHETFGRKIVQFILERGLLLSDNKDKYVDTYLKKILKCTKSDSKKYIDMSSAAFSNLGKFEELVQIYFNENQQSMNQRTINQIKHLAYRIDLPRPIIQDSEQRCFVKFPTVKPCLLNRIALIDNSVIRPLHPIKDPEWKVDSDLQELLWKIEKLGDLKYTFVLEYYLTHHLMEGRVDEDHFQTIKRLILSYSFKKYLIEDTGFFKNQKPSALLNLQIKFRSKIAISQLHQYFSLLSLEQQSQWMKKMVEMLVMTANSLSGEEVDVFFKELNHKLAKSSYSLDDMHKRRTVEILKHNNVNILNMFGNKKSTLASKRAIEIGHRYLKYLIIRYNLNNHLSHFLDLNRNFFDLVDSLYPKKELYETIGHNLYNSRELDSKITKMINIVYQNRHQAPFQIHKIPEMKVSITNRGIGFRAKFSLRLVSQPSLILPKLKQHNDLSKLLLINYFHSRTFLEAIKSNLPSNRNRLPDVITMFGSMGSEYYSYLVTKKLDGIPDIDSAALDRLKFWLLDKKFKLIVSEMSDFLVSPFSHEDADIDRKVELLCLKLFKENSRNEYFLLRYHNQIFNQYMGSLTYKDSELLESWVSDLVDEILQPLREAPIKEQRKIIADFEDAITEYRPFRFR
jgi:hypothetical protein